MTGDHREHAIHVAAPSNRRPWISAWHTEITFWDAGKCKEGDRLPKGPVTRSLVWKEEPVEF